MVAVVHALSALARIPGSRELFALAAGLGALLHWPTSSLRRRSRRVGLRVSPWRWGAHLGRNLWRLLRARPVDALPGTPAPGAGLVLAAHLGPWEAGAAALARRGLRPLVVAAPWPRLPRSEALLASLRARAGVRSLPRTRAGWRAATRALRAGDTVVVLVDSASPHRPGRRPVPFVDGPIGAPDALVRWARRQGAPVWLALGRDDGFELRPLGADAADVAVAELAAAVRERPSTWAWVQALAALLLAVLPGCAPEPVAPLPLEPERWVAEAEGVVWEGALEDGWAAQLSASRVEGRWVDGRLDGRFETVIVGLVPEGADVPFATATARTADGRWPDGPLVLRDAAWDVDGRTDGASPAITWLGGGAWDCGGCPLEALAEALAQRGPDALREAP